MQPRNAREREVVRLYNRLPALTKSQRLWIEKTIVPTKIATSGHRCWCSRCGGEWREDGLGKTAVCPHCGEVAEVQVGRQTTMRGFDYAQFVQVFRGWQVIRTVLVRYDCRKGREWRIYDMEVWQKWCQPGKPMITLGAQLSGYPYYRQIPYSLWGGGLSIKNNSDYYYKDWMRAAVCPRMTLLPVYSKTLGKHPHFSDYSATDLLGNIFGCPYLESLYKANKHEELREMLGQVEMLNKYWPSVRVALRHGFKPRYWASYWDHLRALKYLRYDMRSPRYVAPPDFDELHDLVARQYRNKIEAVMRKMNEARQLREALRQEEEAKRCAESFMKRIAKFAELQIEDDDIVISPLMSIEAFRDEGAAMHHCVFSMGYYKRPKSLILSARTRAENARVETIEVNLNDFTITQSMGAHDRPTERHEQILSLVNWSMPIIKRMAVAV